MDTTSFEVSFCLDVPTILNTSLIQSIVVCVHLPLFLPKFILRSVLHREQVSSSGRWQVNLN